MEPRFIIWQVDKHNFTWWVSSYGGHHRGEEAMAAAKADPQKKGESHHAFFYCSNEYRVVNEGLYRTGLRDCQTAVCIGLRDLSKPLHM